MRPRAVPTLGTVRFGRSDSVAWLTVLLLQVGLVGWPLVGLVPLTAGFTVPVKTGAADSGGV